MFPPFTCPHYCRQWSFCLEANSSHFEAQCIRKNGSVQPPNISPTLKRVHSCLGKLVGRLPQAIPARHVSEYLFRNRRGVTLRLKGYALARRAGQDANANQMRDALVTADAENMLGQNATTVNSPIRPTVVPYGDQYPATVHFFFAALFANFIWTGGCPTI